jgi:acetyl-CoA acetyltransferase
MARDVFVLGGKRTPMGGYVGALKDTSAIDLGAIAARAEGIAIICERD